MAGQIPQGKIAPVNTGLLVYGSGGHSRIVAEIAALNGLHVSAFAVHPQEYTAQPSVHCPATIESSDGNLKLMLDAGVRKAALAVEDCNAREHAALHLIELGFTLITLIHPSSVVSSSAVIGLGSVICAGVIICNGAHIGDGVIVNTGAIIDYDCKVSSWSHISPGVKLAGAVWIGSGAWIGIGAIISDHRRVGFGSIVGAGSTVVRDIPQEVVAYGCPARVTRWLKVGEIPFFSEQRGHVTPNDLVA